jgi:hypothetical protein
MKIGICRRAKTRSFWEDAMFKKFLLWSAAFVACLTPGLAAKETQDAGVPNLMSADFGWQPSSGLDFLPIDGKVAPTRRGGVSQQGERLSDAENPNLTSWAAAQMRKRNDEVKNGHRAFEAQSRCWPGGVPGQLLFVAEPVYFIQTPKEVWIIWERDHLVRRVFLNREHSPHPKPSWFGESVGRYENGELVVDTIGFVENELSVVDSYATPHTKDLHVVEHWKLADGGSALEATVTVDDPGAFKTSWWAKARWQKINRGMQEWVCAENNLGYEQFFKLPEYPMPVANTPDF